MVVGMSSLPVSMKTNAKKKLDLGEFRSQIKQNGYENPKLPRETWTIQTDFIPNCPRLKLKLTNFVNTVLYKILRIKENRVHTKFCIIHAKPPE